MIATLPHNWIRNWLSNLISPLSQIEKRTWLTEWNELMDSLVKPSQPSFLSFLHSFFPCFHFSSVFFFFCRASSTFFSSLAFFIRPRERAQLCGLRFEQKRRWECDGHHGCCHGGSDGERERERESVAVMPRSAWEDNINGSVAVWLWEEALSFFFFSLFVQPTE